MIPLRDTLKSYSPPVMTVMIIAVNVLVFFYQLSLSDYELNHFISRFGIVPAHLRYSSLFTSMFLHGGWMHLIGNMWFLWIFGDNVEDVLGHDKYLIFYILCGLAAAVTHVLLNADTNVPTIGASGAIAGVMGAYYIKFPHARIVSLVMLFIFFTTIEVPAAFMLIVWFIMQIFSGIGSIGYSNVSRGGTAWFAHVGGFVAGMILIKIMRTNDRYRRRSDLLW
jgi:membrane associated rhomboid family serine protease